mmetsp:Transcript_19715/g.55412  ORF Transcript_19715/g.55412 Transcript_19715/m.55412 type:complete len:622 (-) Transcript_19715:23-1888(-)
MPLGERRKHGVPAERQGHRHHHGPHAARGADDGDALGGRRPGGPHLPVHHARHGREGRGHPAEQEERPARRRGQERHAGGHRRRRRRGPRRHPRARALRPAHPEVPRRLPRQAQRQAGRARLHRRRRRGRPRAAQDGLRGPRHARHRHRRGEERHPRRGRGPVRVLAHEGHGGAHRRGALHCGAIPRGLRPGGRLHGEGRHRRAGQHAAGGDAAEAAPAQHVGRRPGQPAAHPVARGRGRPHDRGRRGGPRARALHADHPRPAGEDRGAREGRGRLAGGRQDHRPRHRQHRRPGGRALRGAEADPPAGDRPDPRGHHLVRRHDAPHGPGRRRGDRRVPRELGRDAPRAAGDQGGAGGRHRELALLHAPGRRREAHQRRRPPRQPDHGPDGGDGHAHRQDRPRLRDRAAHRDALLRDRGGGEGGDDREGPGGHREGQGAGAERDDRGAHPVRRRRQPRDRGPEVQDRHGPRPRPGLRLHLPRPRRREHRLQDHAAVQRLHRHRADHAGPPPAHQRPEPGQHRPGHRLDHHRHVPPVHPDQEGRPRVQALGVWDPPRPRRRRPGGPSDHRAVLAPMLARLRPIQTAAAAPRPGRSEAGPSRREAHWWLRVRRPAHRVQLPGLF